MAIGFQAVGASGAWQADDTFASLALRARGSATLGGSVYNRSGSATIDVGQGPFDTPILAIRSDFPTVVTVMVQSAGRSAYLVQAPSNPQDGQNVGKSFDWWLFDRPIDLNSTSGAVVRDANNRVTFDAYQKYSRVRGVLTVPDFGSGSADFGAGVLACVTTRIGIVTSVSMLVPGANYTYDVAFQGFAVQGSKIVCKSWLAHHQEHVIAPDGPYPNLRNGEVLILDVTNY